MHQRRCVRTCWLVEDFPIRLSLDLVGGSSVNSLTELFVRFAYVMLDRAFPVRLCGLVLIMNCFRLICWLRWTICHHSLDNYCMNSFCNLDFAFFPTPSVSKFEFPFHFTHGNKSLLNAVLLVNKYKFRINRTADSVVYYKSKKKVHVTPTHTHTHTYFHFH